MFLMSEVPLYSLSEGSRARAARGRGEGTIVFHDGVEWGVHVTCQKMGNRGTSLIRNRPPLGPYSSICTGPYGVPRGWRCFL